MEEVSRDFPPPKPMKPRFEVDQSQYCIFHEDKGHDVDDYQELKKIIIERLKLGEFNPLKPSNKGGSTTRKFAWKKGKDKAPEKHIHMIQMWHSGHVRKAKALEEWECAPITFPAFWKVCPKNLPLTVTAKLGRCRVSRIYIDTDSAVDVIYTHYFLQLPQDVWDKVKPSLHPVAGFTGETTWPLGCLSIEVKLGDDHRSCTVQLTFVVVRSQSKYNVILGRTTLQELGAIPSTVHGMLKFPTMAGVVTLFSDRAPVCAEVSQPVIQTTPIKQ
ncbi:uncharacterized protein [Rutidosis leptorrhynchoides]|uniref:uncharacterized protein n=1 Tax=Rutidosis leptorrhynchoides TaxID=125765 RepID=UPI003A9981D2